MCIYDIVYLVKNTEQEVQIEDLTEMCNDLTAKKREVTV